MMICSPSLSVENLPFVLMKLRGVPYEELNSNYDNLLPLDKKSFVDFMENKIFIFSININNVE